MLCNSTGQWCSVCSVERLRKFLNQNFYWSLMSAYLLCVEQQPLPVWSPWSQSLLLWSLIIETEVSSQGAQLDVFCFLPSFLSWQERKEEKHAIELVIVCATGRASSGIYSVTLTFNQRIHFCSRWKVESI